LRNVGPKAVTVSNAYLDGALGTLDSTPLVNVGATAAVVITGGANLDNGAAHTMKIVCTDEQR